MKLKLNGVILDNDTATIYRYFGLDAISPKLISFTIDKLAEGEELEIDLNSPGGYCSAGAAIYSMLKAASAAGHEVIINVIGEACSAATVVMCGADTVKGSRASTYMFHNASLHGASGKSRDMRSYAQSLEETDESIINVYEERTGKTRDELHELIDAETWMNVKRAIEYGFVDEIYLAENENKDDEPVRLVASSGGLIPMELLNVMKKEYLQNNENGNSRGAVDINNSNRRSEKMNLNEAYEKHPELKDEVDKLVNEAKSNVPGNNIDKVVADAVDAERKRIQDIQSIAGSIPEDMVKEAMFTNPCDAKELAFKALQDDNLKLSNYMQHAMEDVNASNSADVKAAPSDLGENNASSDMDKAQAQAARINKKRNK